MSTCCEGTPRLNWRPGDVVIALAGNPNSGKTTIFNALTGLRQKVANYPGVTVEKKTGRCPLGGGQCALIIDLPGTYSLISRSLDETVAMEVLRGMRADTPVPDVVVVVVDASNLQRNLYLVSQLVELGRPMVVALNMMDIAQRRGLRISPERLSRELGVPVVPVVGHKRQGIDELKRAIQYARISPLPEWDLPREMQEELLVVGGALAILDDNEPLPKNLAGVGFRIPCCADLAGGTHVCPPDNCRAAQARLQRYTAVAERLLVGDRAADMGDVAGRDPVASLLRAAESRLSAHGIDAMQADIEAHYRWIEGVAAQSLTPACEDLLPMESGIVGEQTMTLDGPSEAHQPEDARITGQTLAYAPPTTHASEQVDQVFLHKIWGMVCFVAIMATLFVSIFWLAQPLMDATKAGVTWVGELVTPLLPVGPVRDLWSQGIVAGVGGVVVFVPQIAILFAFLAMLEDSGYLARAAFLMDRILSKVGLNGKSFIPLLSSFACAIPGIMAARTIENRRERLATIFVAPFMSCSARLPVYGLLIGAFFGAYSALVQGGILLSMYLIGITAAAGTAWLFKLGGEKEAASSFILELPTYKIPQWSQVLRAVYTNTKAFIMKAGTIIVCLSVVLWALMYYPRLSEQQIAEAEAGAKTSFVGTNVDFKPGISLERMAEIRAKMHEKDMQEAVEQNRKNKETSVAAEQLRQSTAGRFGHLIEPVIKPLGFDWKMGVGLVGAFAAREVFVSTMGIVYSVGAEDENTAPLEQQMAADKSADGRPVWTPLVAISLLIWFVLAMQCMSTLAIVRRETGSWKWPVLMLVYMNALAWVVCFSVYQVGSRLI